MSCASKVVSYVRYLKRNAFYLSFCSFKNKILAKSNYFQKLQTVNATNFQALAAEFGGQSFTLTQETQPPLLFYRVSPGKGLG